MSRDRNQNLYAEQIITESPFYYDEHGRLRVRVLNEMDAAPAASDEEEQKKKAAAAQPAQTPEKKAETPAPEEKKAETPAPEKKADVVQPKVEPKITDMRARLEDKLRRKPGGGSNINKKPIRPQPPVKGGDRRPGLPPKPPVKGPVKGSEKPKLIDGGRKKPMPFSDPYIREPNKRDDRKLSPEEIASPLQTALKRQKEQTDRLRAKLGDEGYRKFIEKAKLGKLKIRPM